MLLMTAADCQLVTQRCVKLREEDAAPTKFILSPVSSCSNLAVPGRYLESTSLQNSHHPHCDNFAVQGDLNWVTQHSLINFIFVYPAAPDLQRLEDALVKLLKLRPYLAGRWGRGLVPSICLCWTTQKHECRCAGWLDVGTCVGWTAATKACLSQRSDGMVEGEAPELWRPRPTAVHKAP